MLIIPYKQGYSAIFCITFVATYSSYSAAVYNINCNAVYRTENILVPHSRVPGFTLGVGGVRVTPYLVFCVFVVCLYMSCVPNIASVSGLSIPLCLVCRILPVSLDCPFLFAPSVFSNVHSIY
jgi:hypothetical protein